MALRIALPNLLIVIGCHSCTPLLSDICYFTLSTHLNAAGSCPDPADLSVEIEGFQFNLLYNFYI